MRFDGQVEPMANGIEIGQAVLMRIPLGLFIGIGPTPIESG